MFDFVATKEKALKAARDYGLKPHADFELKRIVFNDNKSRDSVFWTLRYNDGAALISVYGFLKMVESNKIEKILDVQCGEKYSMCGNCFKITTDRSSRNIALTPSQLHS